MVHVIYIQRGWAAGERGGARFFFKMRERERPEKQRSNANQSAAAGPAAALLLWLMGNDKNCSATRAPSSFTRSNVAS